MLQTGETDIAATHGLHAELAGFIATAQRKEIHSVGVIPLRGRIREDDLSRQGGENLLYHTIRAVTNTGFA